MAIAKWPQKSEKFLKEVKVEMQKVSWPNRQEVINFTIIVLIAVIALSIYIFGVDMVYTLVRNIVLGS